MDSYREEIKDGFISELGINPISYDEKRGYDRTSSRSSSKSYVYDTADEILLKVANEYLHANRKHQLFRTFIALYYCRNIFQTQRLLSSHSHKDVENELPIETIRTYKKRSKDIILKALGDDNILKEKLLKAIQIEYDK